MSLPQRVYSRDQIEKHTDERCLCRPRRTQPRGTRKDPTPLAHNWLGTHSTQACFSLLFGGIPARGGGRPAARLCVVAPDEECGEANIAREPLGIPYTVVRVTRGVSGLFDLS